MGSGPGVQAQARGSGPGVQVQGFMASFERVSSILKRHSTQSQPSALQDYVEVEVMLEVNIS